MEYDFREIGDIGLEIEFSNIKRETPNFVNTLQKRLGNFKHVHDASSETPELCVGNIPIQFDIDGKTNKLLSIVRNRNLEVYGGEINSPIMHSDDFKQHIYKLIDFLIDMGESHSTTEQDNRGSIHVHVNVSRDIKHKHLIRLLELGLATEAIFYRLGGMGRVNRGVKNSFIYQRPLTLPPCVPYNNKYYPIFDYRDLLQSRGKADFYNKYGDSVFQIHNGGHYVTQRYMGLNFYSIPYRGSIEFRYANKVLIPEWIIAWIVLCQSFVAFALNKPKDQSFEDVYRKLEDNRNIPFDELNFIFNKFNIPEEYKITLFDIWRESEMPYFNGKQVVTHLQNPSFYVEKNYLPTPVSIAEKIIVKDVRNINSEKNYQMMSAQSDSNVEVDYIIDTSGVKSKLKDMGIRAEENNNRRGDDYTRNWILIAGFNINHFSQEDVLIYIQERILSNRFIPLSLLRPHEHYEFDTNLENITIFISTTEERNALNVVFYNTNLGMESIVSNIEGERVASLDCHVVRLENIINDCRINPNNYFNEDDLNLENVEEILDVEQVNINVNPNRPILRINNIRR